MAVWNKWAMFFRSLVEDIIASQRYVLYVTLLCISAWHFKCFKEQHRPMHSLVKDNPSLLLCWRPHEWVHVMLKIYFCMCREICMEFYCGKTSSSSQSNLFVHFDLIFHTCQWSFLPWTHAKITPPKYWRWTGQFMRMQSIQFSYIKSIFPKISKNNVRPSAFPNILLKYFLSWQSLTNIHNMGGDNKDHVYFFQLFLVLDWTCPPSLHSFLSCHIGPTDCQHFIHF